MRIGPFGMVELLLILLVVLLIFGASRLPGVGSALGKGIRSFKTSVTGEDEGTKREASSPESGTEETRSWDGQSSGVESALADKAITAVELARLGAIAGVSAAMFLAAIGAAVGFGRLTQPVAHLESHLGGIDNCLDAVQAAINELRAELRQPNAEIQQSNRILVGLANYRHDTDSDTVFTIPQP